MARKPRGRGKPTQDSRREFLKLAPGYLAVVVAGLEIVLTERREAARDHERKLDRLSARLDEAVKQVLAAPVPPVGSGAPDPQ